MHGLRRRSFFLGGIAFTGSVRVAAFENRDPEEQHFFLTDEFEIRMNLAYYDNSPDAGLRFRDRATDQRFCLSGQGQENLNCTNNFKGSIAVARYRLFARRGGRPRSPIMREYVRSIDQSDDLRLRPPFERVIEVRSGLASDIQVFGYQDKSSAAKRDESDDGWCLLRQNLYLEQQGLPFLILHWKHTVAAIRVLDIIPENGTRVVRQRR